MAHVVIARWTAKEGEEDAVAAALAALTEPSRAEPGNLAYVVHRDPADRRRFVIYERYRDEAAYEAHAASEHFKRHGLEDGIPRLASREREFLVPVDDA
jgi:quinol monooxygenase YgiN